MCILDNALLKGTEVIRKIENEFRNFEEMNENECLKYKPLWDTMKIGKLKTLKVNKPKKLEKCQINLNNSHQPLEY